MAALRGIAKQSGISTGTAAKTLLQLIAPTNQRIKIVGLSIGFAGIVATDPPVLIEILRQTTAGTMTSHTASLVKSDQRRNESIQTTSQHTATVEPTAGDIYRGWRMHPQSGLYIPEDMLKDIIINGGDRLGFRATTGTSQSAEICVEFEE